MARFDDRLRNLLALARDKSPANRIALFRHLADLLLQGRPLGDDHESGTLLEILGRLRNEVPVTIRQDVVDDILSQSVHPLPLIRLLASDDLSVARPLLDRLQLPENDWLDVIASLPPENRRHLRIRADLTPALRRALKEEPVPSTPAAEVPGVSAANESQIRRLFGQLAAVSAEQGAAPEEAAAPPPASPPQQGWTAARDAAALFGTEDTPPPAAPEEKPLPPIGRALAASRPAPVPHPAEAGVDWLWETDRMGRLTAVGGDPGCFLDEPGEALLGRFLFDLFGTARDDAARLERRMIERRPFRDMALTAKAALGDGRWRLSGVPHFDLESGLFQGYRGTGRAEGALDALRAAPPAPLARAPKPAPIDPVHWAHEMRTPLNAIKGFAEMIENQPWGDVAAAYRDRSARIRQAAQRADGVIGDLMALARLEGGSLRPVPEDIDLAALVSATAAALQADDGLEARIRRADPVPHIWGDQGLCARIVEKMLRAGRAWTAPQEPVEVKLGPDHRGGARLSVQLPKWRDGDDAAALHALGAYHPGDVLMKAAPPLAGLGLDFAARLAAAMDGQLALGRDSTQRPLLTLVLPPVIDSRD